MVVDADLIKYKEDAPAFMSMSWTKQVRQISAVMWRHQSSPQWQLSKASFQIYQIETNAERSAVEHV